MELSSGHWQCQWFRLKIGGIELRSPVLWSALVDESIQGGTVFQTRMHLKKKQLKKKLKQEVSMEALCLVLCLRFFFFLPAFFWPGIQNTWRWVGGLVNHLEREGRFVRFAEDLWLGTKSTKQAN